jgi:hypothetical protein
VPVTWKPVAPGLVEQANSPQLEYTGNSARRTRSFKGLHSLCLTSIPYPGTIGTAADAGWVVESSSVAREKGDIGILTVVWIPAPFVIIGTIPLPPDEAGIAPTALNPKIERHPRYNSLTPQQLQNVQDALAAGAGGDTSKAYLDLPARGQELYTKISQGWETFYLAGMTYSWAKYYYSLPALSLGSYPETPGGPLAPYLRNMSCLRAADSLVWAQYCWKLTRTWLAMPNLPGTCWDPQLYPIRS